MPHRALRQIVCSNADPTRMLDRITLGIESLLPAADGAAMLVREQTQLRVVAANGVVGGLLEQTMPGHASLAGQCVQQARVLFSEDLQNDARDQIGTRWPITTARSAIFAPLLQGAQTVGIVAAFSRAVSAFGLDDAATLADITGFAAVALTAFLNTSAAAYDALDALGEPVLVYDGNGNAQPRLGDRLKASEFLAELTEPGSVVKAYAHRRVQEVLSDENLSVVAQPIVDINSGSLLGAEALARIPCTPRRAPNEWFDEAHQVGLGLQLEALAVRRALTALPQVPDDRLLAINISHDLLVSGDLTDLLADQPGERLIIELTEHLAFSDYERTLHVLRDLRSRGVRLAVDDVGAGFSSFRHIVELVPEFIKLDRLFIDGIVEDPARRAMTLALVAFADEIGALLIAEGIETVEQLAVARDLGVRYGQGYLIARPAPAQELASRYSGIAAVLGRYEQGEYTLRRPVQAA